MKFFFSIISIGMLLAGIFLGYTGQTAVPITLVTGAVILLMLAKMEQLTEVTAGVFSARSRIEQVIRDAKITLEQIQDLACEIVNASLIQMRCIGVIDGMPIVMYDEACTNLISSVERLNVSEEKINVLIRDELFKKVLCQYIGYIESEIFNNNGEDVHKKFMNNINSIKDKYGSIQYKDLKRIIDEVNCNSEIISELIDQYKFYIENMKHRRTEKWKNYYK